MDIASLKFAFWAIVSVFIYYFLPFRFRVAYLVILSCLFCATYDIYLPVYLAVYAALNFFIAQKLPSHPSKKALFRLGIVLNLTQLILIRYASFAIDPILELFGTDIKVSVLSSIIIPIGMSYYTLQGIGYLINVKMGWEKPEKNFLRFFLYIIFFPKFISGPIERSNLFLQQFPLKNEFDSSNLTEGFRLALLGFFKKIIIANHLGNSISQLYSCTDDYMGYQIIALILLQPLYLYFDFSGYTDIALGFARAFGIKLSPNFNKPFLSENMTIFWRRFHISLSSWFNDYVFKQTSFRLRRLKGKATVIAVFLTWILFGIWHGAGWNFMVLGVLQALAIYYEFRTKNFRNKLFSLIPGYSRQLAGRLFTYCFYALSLTFFFAPDLPSVWRVFSEISSPLEIQKISLLNKSLLFSMALVVIFLLYEVLQNDFNSVYRKIHMLWVNNKAVRIIVYYAGLFLILTQLDGNASFIYEMF